MVSAIAFFLDDQSSNRAEAYIFYLKILFETNKMTTFKMVDALKGALHSNPMRPHAGDYVSVRYHL